MKTRIKVVTKGDGSKEYFPQYRFFFIWPSWADTDYMGLYGPFYTLESAQEEIDRWLKLQQWSKEHEKAKKVVNVEYVKYP